MMNAQRCRVIHTAWRIVLCESVTSSLRSADWIVILIIIGIVVDADADVGDNVLTDTVRRAGGLAGRRTCKRANVLRSVLTGS